MIEGVIVLAIGWLAGVATVVVPAVVVGWWLFTEASRGRDR